MYNRNSGYIGSKMSVRAKEAYDDGLKPWSKWKKSDILAYYDDFPELRKKLSKYSLSVLKDYFLFVSEWHHTSSFFNETDFWKFSFSSEPDFSVLDKMQENYQKAANSKKNVKLEKAKVKYREFEKSRTRRRHPKSKVFEEFAILKGDWAYTKTHKKKLSGNHIEVLEKYPRAPIGTKTEFDQIKKLYNLK